MKSVIEMLFRLKRERFYGNVTLCFRNGRMVRKEETLRLDDSAPLSMPALAGEVLQ